MSTTTAEVPLSPAPVSPPPRRTRGALFHPLVDFLALGGLTAVVALVIALLPKAWLEYSAVLAGTTMLAHAINNPHFAHSYQLFYRGFLDKTFGGGYAPEWRARYLFAGVIVPLALVGYFAWAIAGGHVEALGLSVNLMFFTVGWHYTKQGYGMLVLDSVVQKRYFDEAEKRVFLANGHAVWLLSWITANEVWSQSNYWGIPWTSFSAPHIAVQASWALAGFTTLRVLVLLARRLKSGRALPFNGLVAYSVSLYVWLLVREPILALIFPALHSLQYLLVVWRFELNRQRHQIHRAEGGRDDETPDPAPFELWLRMGGFYGLAVALGWAGFWGFGNTMGHLLPEPLYRLGGGVFLLAAWIFINVHHYFIDNVQWRKGNPETGRYLFASGR